MKKLYKILHSLIILMLFMSSYIVAQNNYYCKRTIYPKGNRIENGLGMAMDKQGFIYVCSGNQDSIYMIDNDLKVIKSINPKNYEFNYPCDVKIMDNNFYVLEIYGNVRVYDEKWASINNFGSDKLSYPRCMAIDSKGYVYITDNELHKVAVFTKDGAFIKDITYNNGQGLILESPFGVTINGENLYVTSETQKKIFVFDTAGTFIKTIGDSLLENPRGLTLDSVGNFYVANSEGNLTKLTFSEGAYTATPIVSPGRIPGKMDNPTYVQIFNNSLFLSSNTHPKIEKYDLSGNWQRTLGGYCSFSPNEAKRQADGSFIAVNSTDYSIVKMDKEGYFEFVIGEYGSGDGQFDKPMGVAVDKAGNIFVSDMLNGRIQKFDKFGKFIAQKSKINDTYDGQIDGPHGIIIDNENNLLLCENSRILKFNTNLDFIEVVAESGKGGLSLYQVEKIAQDAKGNFYITQSGKEQILVLNNKFQFLKTIDGSGSDDDHFCSVGGIAFDTLENMYIVDTYHAKIQKYNAAGNFVTSIEKYPNGGNRFYNPTGIEVDSKGSIFLSDSESGLIHELVLSRLSQKITFPPIPEKIEGAPDFVISAYSNSGLIVDFTSSNVNVATVYGPTVSVIGEGTTIITANQKGNELYEPAEPISQTLIVKAKPVVTEIENKLSFVSIYPNPATEKITIGLDKQYSFVCIEIFNNYGEKVFSTRNETNGTIEIEPKLKQGIYFLRVITDSDIFSSDLIIQQ